MCLKSGVALRRRAECESHDAKNTSAAIIIMFRNTKAREQKKTQESFDLMECSEEAAKGQEKAVKRQRKAWERQ